MERPYYGQLSCYGRKIAFKSIMDESSNPESTFAHEHNGKIYHLCPSFDNYLPNINVVYRMIN